MSIVVSKVLLLILSLSLFFVCSNASLAFAASADKLGNLKVFDLKCEYATNPMGLDVRALQFSWCLESGERGLVQKTYRVIVSDTPEGLSSDYGNIWDSGEASSSKSTGILFRGKDMESRKRYYWKVRVLGTDGLSSGWSDPAYFETGLMEQEDWKAEWIGVTANWLGRVLYFRKSFTAQGTIVQARTYISGIGYYLFHLNGQKVGDHVLNPGTTCYNKQVLYATFDITGFLKKENKVDISVGPGWYGLPKLRAQIEITYEDGSTEIIATAGSSAPGWKVSVGPIISSIIYDGETYDARLEGDVEKGQGTRWVSAVNVDPLGGKMVSQKLEPIKVVDTLIPDKISEPFPGIYVIDAGRNLTGWASIKVMGERGSKVTLKFAEVLYPDGTVNQENLRTAVSKDTYILKGEGEEQWGIPSTK